MGPRVDAVYKKWLPVVDGNDVPLFTLKMPDTHKNQLELIRQKRVEGVYYYHLQ